MPRETSSKLLGNCWKTAGQTARKVLDLKLLVLAKNNDFSKKSFECDWRMMRAISNDVLIGRIATTVLSQLHDYRTSNKCFLSDTYT